MSTQDNQATLLISPSEWEILQHRLHVPDAVAECLCDTFDHFGFADVEAKAEEFAKLEPINAGTATGCRIIRVGLLDEVQIAILKECLEGSTFFTGDEDAVALGKVSRGAILQQKRAATTIAAKFRSAGIPTTGVQMG